MAAVAARRPDAVLVSGDLTDHAADAEYEQVRELLAPLEAPLYVLNGNHDDRGGLRRHFGLAGSGDEPVQYVAELGPLRLVVLDTTIPGADAGSVDEPRLAWLDGTLGEAPETPTVIAMHHPPLLTGVAPWDELGLPAADRRALADVVERHPQVQRLVAGHVHRVITTEIGGRSLVTCPSTYVQARLEFGAQEIELAPSEPRGYALHAMIDGDLVSHVQPVLD